VRIRAIKHRHPASLPSGQLLDDLPPLLRRIYLQRGIRSAEELNRQLGGMLPPGTLKGLPESLVLLHSAMLAQKKIMVIGDFDADGATSTTLAMLGLSAMGAKSVDYLVPDRFKFGYGLSAGIVEVAVQQGAELIITVDNGISSVEGVAAAKQAGIQVLITDHHLPGQSLPAADAILNPNQNGCEFPSKNLAGVGVVFYLLVALRAHLRDLAWFEEQGLPEPNLADYLDLVALGTVADVVPLDRNNRTLVFQGLQRIRAGKCRPGILALLSLAGREPSRIVASDLGFAVGPRLNAAGRLDSMSLGIECLLTNDADIAMALAEDLDTLNRERRIIEGGMKEEALRALEKLQLGSGSQLPWGLALFHAGWHQGVIGIVASRVKDLHHRPVVAFAPADDQVYASGRAIAGDAELKGSARSISGFHIRDALEAVSSKHPGLILKFGGHAMAAGLSILAKDFTTFSDAFDQQVRKLLDESDLNAELLSDGDLQSQDISLENAEMLRNQGPWGQGFPEPLFDGQFEVLQQRIVGEKHLKLVLSHPASNSIFDAIAFNVDLQQWPNKEKYVQLVYRLDVNEYRGQRSVQLMVQFIAPLASLE
jgi:single-stranded-DNA-specific exonuclease